MSMCKKPTAKVLIVDDHPIVREGLEIAIRTQAELEVCGQAATEDEALALVKEKQPDIILVDISLKDGNGLEVVRRVKSGYPKVKILVISAFQESLYAERALRAGAMGYLNKGECIDHLIEAIRTVLNGKRYVGMETLQRLASQALNSDEAGDGTPIERLTNRELDVFRMIGEGLSSGSIASRLLLSTHTVDTHRENIKRKLNIKTATELTRCAVQWLLENG